MALRARSSGAESGRELFNPLTTARAQFFGHELLAARELFKPSMDSASLLVEIEKKNFSFLVWGSLGGPPQVFFFAFF